MVYKRKQQVFFDEVVVEGWGGSINFMRVVLTCLDRWIFFSDFLD